MSHNLWRVTSLLKFFPFLVFVGILVGGVVVNLGGDQLGSFGGIFGRFVTVIFCGSF